MSCTLALKKDAQALVADWAATIKHMSNNKFVSNLKFKTLLVLQVVLYGMQGLMNANSYIV